MRQSFANAVFLLSFFTALALAGCSGPSSSSTSNSLSVFPSTAILIPGQEITVTTAASGPASSEGFNLTLTPAVGMFSPGPCAFTHTSCDETFYTAPLAVSSPLPVTITATSVADPAVSASATITIDPTGSYLYGWFSFLFSGFDANGAVSAAGTFNVDQNGNIAMGEEDFKDANTQNPAPQPITGSCQNFTVIDTGFCKLTAGGKTFQYDFALRSDFEFARFIEDSADGLAIGGSGMMASPFYFRNFSTSGNYLTFGLIGSDAGGARLGVAGTVSFPNSSPSGTGQADLNDDGALIQPTSAQNQNISATNAPEDGFGRQEMQITFDSSPQRTFTLATYYPFATDVSPAPAGGKAQVLTGQFFALPVAQSGQPSFGSTSVSGSSVFELWGLTSGGTTTTIGTLSPSSSPNVLMDTNIAGSIDGGAGAAAPQMGSISGLTFAANGRAQFSTVIGAATSNYVAYLDAANSGFLLGTDVDVSFGFLQAQASPPNFSNATITGNYATGTFLPVSAAVQNVAAITTLTPTAAFSGTLTSGSTTGAYSFDPTTGRGTVNTSAGTILGDSSAVFYIIDSADIVLMGSQAGQPQDAIELLEF